MPVPAGASGVLSCCTAALVVSAYAWPLMCNKETVHTVWHTLEYFGNTLIFLLAGCIIGR